jgi:hypothetical protein
MKKIITNTFFSATFILFSIGCSGKVPSESPNTPSIILSHFDSMLVKKVVATKEDTSKMYFVDNHKLKTERWDQLAQPAFWIKIICLSPDSCIVNIADTRESLVQVPYNDWKLISEAELTRNKSKVRQQYNIEADRELYVTSGKRDFFEHRKTMIYLSKAVGYFKDNGVDPWYAQTILLIESPGKHKSVSYAGANGPFQLMKSVATQYGLVVNATRDDRTDLKKASYASSQLISKICIPLVKKMLNSRNIPYNETDTWFRLLVMHSYHAGAGNVACALNKINPTTGGQELIIKLWKTEACGFKNESQNYSQLALAALLNFQDLIDAEGDTVFTVYGCGTLGDIGATSVTVIPDDLQLRMWASYAAYKLALKNTDDPSVAQRAFWGNWYNETRMRLWSQLDTFLRMPGSPFAIPPVTGGSDGS